MKLDREAYLKTIGKYIAGNDDESLTDIENLTDTFSIEGNEEVTRLNGEIESLRTQVLSVENEWRRRYRDRFFNSEVKEEVEEQEADIKRDSEEVSFDELFKNREGGKQ